VENGEALCVHSLKCTRFAPLYSAHNHHLSLLSSVLLHPSKDVKSGPFLSRLETRTKEYNMWARVRVIMKPIPVMKVKNKSGWADLYRNPAHSKASICYLLLGCHLKFICCDPKDGELYLCRMKSGETLMEVR